MQLVAGGVVLPLITGLHSFLNHTERGQAAWATSQNHPRAELVGIDTRTVHSLVFGGLLPGVVEVLGAPYSSLDDRDAYGLVVFLLILLLRPEGLFGRTVKRV